MTATILVSGAASTAARTAAMPPTACTVSRSGRSLATARAAPATVAGMSLQLQVEKDPDVIGAADRGHRFRAVTQI